MESGPQGTKETLVPETPAFSSPGDWEETRKTLHLYSQILGAISRCHPEPHPKWWHLSLQVRPEGFETDHMALPGGGTFWLELDLRRHQIALRTSDGEDRRFDMMAAPTAAEMGDEVLSALADLGLTGDYAREKFEDREPREYDPEAAEHLLAALAAAETLLSRHRETLPGEVGPVQLWPHGFDLAFEWFGTKTESYEGEELPSQINLGLYLHDRPYFYSNPWPFDESLTAIELPSGAEWHTDGWQGSILYYDQVAGDPTGPAKVEAFAQAVHAAAAPTLTA